MMIALKKSIDQDQQILLLDLKEEIDLVKKLSATYKDKLIALVTKYMIILDENYHVYKSGPSNNIDLSGKLEKLWIMYNVDNIQFWKDFATDKIGNEANFMTRLEIIILEICKEASTTYEKLVDFTFNFLYYLSLEYMVVIPTQTKNIIEGISEHWYGIIKE